MDQTDGLSCIGSTVYPFYSTRSLDENGSLPFENSSQPETDALTVRTQRVHLHLFILTSGHRFKTTWPHFLAIFPLIQIKTSHIPIEQITKELQEIENNLSDLEKVGIELERSLRRYEEGRERAREQIPPAVHIIAFMIYHIFENI